MPEMVYDFGREQVVETEDGKKSISNVFIVQDGERTGTVRKAWEPPKKISSISRGYNDFDPLGHMT